MTRQPPLSRSREATRRDRDRYDRDRYRYDRDRYRYDRYDRYDYRYYYGHADRARYDYNWYNVWRHAPGPRWYPGRTGVWIEVVYVRSPHRWYNGARAVRCSVLSDELAYAHDEWHWRNDRYRHSYWYDREHRRLMRALDREWARSGCGHSAIYYERCGGRDWGPLRTAATVIVALEILDVLLDGDWHR